MKGFRIPAIALIGLIALAAAGWYAWRSSGGGALKVVEYRAGNGNDNDTPVAVAAAPDGSVWVTLDSVDALGVVRGGRLERVKRGTASVEPLGIAVAADGVVWTTDATGIAITRLDPGGGLSSVPLGTPLARLGRLAVARDGVVWFAEATSYSFSRIKDGVLTRNVFNSARGGPYGVAVAPDGTVWGTLQSGNQLVSIDPSGKLVEIDVPTRGSAPTDVAVDASGNVWFLEFRGNKIGRYSQGKFSEYAVPEGSTGLSGLAVAGDGSVWFGVLRGHALGRLRDGKVSIHPLPRDSARPYSLAADPAGNIWYADISGYVGMVKVR
jgi:virginiamycin B lyase